MTDRFPDGALDLSFLPRPASIETIAFEAILDARMADLVARFTAAGATYDVGPLETDPAKILQEVDAYREVIVRQRIDDAKLGCVMSNSFGFGGTNATIVMKHVDA